MQQRSAELRTPFSAPKRRWRGARIVPWLVLVVTLAATGILYAAMGMARTNRTRQLFDPAIQRAVADLDRSFGDQIAILQTTAGVLEAKPELSRGDFALFYQRLQRGYGKRTPATIGVSLVEPWSQRTRLVEDATLRGVEGFQFQPPDRRDEVHAVMLVEPRVGRNLRAPGYDMHTDAVRRRAMDTARDQNRPVLTAKTVLKFDAERATPAFVLYLPLYRDHPVDLASRRKELRGFVYSGLRAKELFKSVRQRLLQESIGLELFSGDPHPSNLVLAANVSKDVDLERTLKLDTTTADGALVARFTAGPDFVSPATVQGFVLPIGAALSLLLFTLAVVLSRAHEASERREDEGWLLAEVGRLTSGAEDDDAVLEDLAQAISLTLGAVCRLDLIGEDGRLRTVNTRRNGMAALADLERDFPRLENDRLLRRALEEGETQRANAYPANDERHAARLDPLGVGPVVIVPMVVRSRIVGALTLTRSSGGAPLRDDAVRLAEEVAGRIALAMDNARLYQAVQHEKAELERRVEERTRDLEASNHELESFCYSVSHDLRTPLRSLDGFSRALQEDYGERLDEQGLDFIVRIRAAARRMDELITALLTLSRLTRREVVVSKVNAGEMATDLMHDLDPEGRIAFVVERDLSVQADPRMLTVALENLLSNAVKFTSRTESPRIELGRASDGAIYVRDNGAGFDPQYKNKLFLPFERLHSVREFPGHGIGLATVERIVRRHGGEVRAEGTLGEGATFYLRFPE